ncbi:hypothetical protein NDU88_003341 [Pleurodeles waltl]|uniref:Uncharacterized protein n=1 Tax=Pleurodeles waltl TaxID=8319 RepID=A0AAV7MDK5_PLEWA|nr:hypothetical protein NDU88_003341 [Pleurodeles waltl]
MATTQQFEHHYEGLYACSDILPESLISQFIANLPLRTLSTAERHSLEEELTVRKLVAALACPQSGFDRNPGLSDSVALYANNAAIFQQILQLFGKASGLVLNLTKSTIYLVTAQPPDLHWVADTPVAAQDLCTQGYLLRLMRHWPVR